MVEGLCKFGCKVEESIHHLFFSCDLAKALILFSVPGVVNKSNLECLKYLKAFGVNCFGGEVSKQSIKAKVR